MIVWLFCILNVTTGWALPRASKCARALSIEWRGNVAYPKCFLRPSFEEVLAEHRFVTLDDEHADRLIQDLIVDLACVDRRVITTTIDVGWHVWFWTAAGRHNHLDVWFERDESLRARRAFVRRRNFCQDLIIETPNRLAAIEYLTRALMEGSVVRIEDDPKVFDRLAPPTSGFLL